MAYVELIDWSERYPQLSSLELCYLESTVCHMCGGQKEIGTLHNHG